MPKSLSRVFKLAMSMMFALGAWIYASPEASDPDGNFHLTSVWCGDGHERNICERATTSNGSSISGVVRVPWKVANAKNGLDELSDEEFAYSSYHNESGLYPRGFYWIGSKFVDQSITKTVLLLRWINVGIFVLLFAVLNFVLRRELRMSFNLSLLTLLMPLGLFIISSNNPSSWAVTGLGTYWAFLYGYLNSESKGGNWLFGFFSVLSAAIASQSRGDAALFLLIVSAFVVVTFYARGLIRSTSFYKKLLLLPLVLIPATVSIISSWQTTAVTTGFLDENGVYGRDPNDILHLDMSRVLYNVFRLPIVFAGFFGLTGSSGGVGWGNVYMPEIVSIGMLILLSYLVSFSASQRVKTEFASLLLFLLFLLLLPLVVLHNSSGLLPNFIQSRYLLPPVIALAGIWFSGSTLFLRVAESKLKKRLIAVILITSYVVALHTTMAHFIHGDSNLDWNLNNTRAWWWNGMLQPMTMLFLGSLGFANVVLGVLYDGEKSPVSRAMSMMQQDIAKRFSEYKSKQRISGGPPPTEVTARWSAALRRFR